MSPLLRLSQVVACLGMLGGALAVPAPAGNDSSFIWFPHVAHARRYHRPVSVFASAPAPAPADTSRTARDPGARDVPLEKIPLDLLRQLSDVENFTYFLNNFVDADTLAAVDIGPELENRFGPTDERKSIVNAKAAICQPQLEVVSLMVTTDPRMYYYPSCTRIERCGGCCGSSLMACQPTDTEIVNFKVLVVQYTGSPQMNFKGNEIVPLEKHTKCKCDCIKKARDCNQLQEYRKNECDCVCMNVDEKQKCLVQNDIKDWDDSSCSCKCRELIICASNSYYDEDTCSCVQRSVIRSRRKETNFHDSTL